MRHKEIEIGKLISDSFIWGVFSESENKSAICQFIYMCINLLQYKSLYCCVYLQGEFYPIHIFSYLLDGCYSTVDSDKM